MQEYWVVDPEHEFIIIYSHNEAGAYFGSVPFTEGDLLTSKVLSDFQMDVESIFVSPKH